jgi:hypothetical protein
MSRYYFGSHSWTDWTNEDHEKLKTVFLKKGKQFSTGRFANIVNRSPKAIASRISSMIDPTNYRLFDKDFALKVREIFPEQGPGSVLDQILRSRGCYC